MQVHLFPGGGTSGKDMTRVPRLLCCFINYHDQAHILLQFFFRIGKRNFLILYNSSFKLEGMPIGQTQNNLSIKTNENIRLQFPERNP